MTATVDPKKARLYPEIVPEAIYTTATAGGASIASYANFYPWTISLNSLVTNQDTLNQIRVDGDSGHGLLESETLPRPNSLPYEDLDILFEDSMDVWAVGTAALKAAFGLRITKLTVLEKIKYGVDLSESDLALGNQFNILKEFRAGRLQSTGLINTKFKNIFEVSKKIENTAGDTTTVDKRINVKMGEKAVLLNIGSFGDGGMATEDDTFIKMDRDTSDTGYFSLDVMAMPTTGYSIPCYIPAVDNFEITVSSVTGLGAGDLNVHFRYGVAELTVLEKIKWEQPMTQEDETIANEFDLFNAVKAGVM